MKVNLNNIEKELNTKDELDCFNSIKLNLRGFESYIKDYIVEIQEEGINAIVTLSYMNNTREVIIKVIYNESIFGLVDTIYVEEIDDMTPDIINFFTKLQVIR